MFQGHADTSIDEKGRIIIPAKFRKHILPEANNVMYITLGRDRCIWLFPSYEWIKVLETIRETNPYTEDEVLMRRQMLYHTDELLIDTQHRILLPQTLLNEAGIKKEVLLLGQIERIEIWNPDEYRKYLKKGKDTYESVMQKVMSARFGKKEES